MSITVFVPAHITGFFTIENNPNPLKRGSCGAGFLLDKGVKTTVKKSEIFKANVNQGTDIIINLVLKHFRSDETFEITQDIQLPIGAGFGTSAASALGLSLALNEFLDHGYSLIECGQIAHEVEVSLGGGLGDVIAQTAGGLVLRTKPGAPGIGEVKSFHEDIYIGAKTFGAIDTSSIIGDEFHQINIRKIGRKCLDEFTKDQSISNFLDLSYDFSLKTGLMTGQVRSLVDYFNSRNDILGSSMAMLGNTVFVFAYNQSILQDIDIENFNIYKLNNKGICYDKSQL